MRLDKFLKVSRVIKRRTVANEAADGGRVSVNGKVVKPSYDVKVGDIVEIKFGDKISKFEIIKIPQVQRKRHGRVNKNIIIVPLGTFPNRKCVPFVTLKISKKDVCI